MKDILIKAREKIANGWTQHFAARNGDGNPVHTEDPTAVCF